MPKINSLSLTVQELSIKGFFRISAFFISGNSETRKLKIETFLCFEKKNPNIFVPERTFYALVKRSILMSYGPEKKLCNNMVVFTRYRHF